MRKLIIFLSFSIVFGISLSQAQVQVQVVDEDAQTEQNSNEIHGVMSVKMNPLLFFRGDIPIYIELSITPQLAVEIGAGVTLTDYFSTYMHPYISDDSFNYTLNPELGYSGRIRLKYYAANYGYQPEGAYFALDYRLQSYNSTLKSIGTITNLDQSLSRLNNDVRFSVGYVKYWGDNFFIEPYAGFGVRTRTTDIATPNELTNTITVNSEKSLLPILSLGAKVGIWLF